MEEESANPLCWHCRGRERERGERTIAHAGRDSQGALLADDHALEALVPALDHVARAEGELEELVPGDRRVEFAAVC